MKRLCLYYRKEPESDRWVPGDRFIRPAIRRALRGTPRTGGVDKVFFNLCRGLDKLGAPYQVNLPFYRLRDDDAIGVLGRGRHCLDGYDRPNPIVAGVALMTHPSEWPKLCEDYPVARYLQHSEWASNVYRPYFGDRCAIWPVGIDTEKWAPPQPDRKSVDFLIYDKVYWERERLERELIQPIRDELRKKRLSFEEVRYGAYSEQDYSERLQRCRAMIFLCAHESQGLAYQECLSCDVPILAWDQGWCMDPERFRWGQPEIPATSVPYFNQRCGVKFRRPPQFSERLEEFQSKLGKGFFKPRDYILDHLTLEKCAESYLRMFNTLSH